MCILFLSSFCHPHKLNLLEGSYIKGCVDAADDDDDNSKKDDDDSDWIS